MLRKLFSKFTRLYTKKGRVSLLDKRIKKFYVASLLSLFAPQALAEQSAWFLGGDVSYGIANQIKISALNLVADDIFASDQALANSVGFGIVAGYKQMFTNYFGLRYYANIDYFPFFTYSKFRDLGNTEHFLLNTAINIDALANFYDTEDFSMGAFAGVQLGLNTWGGKLFRLERQFYNTHKSKGSGYDASNTNLSFSASLNLGMRFHFKQHHGLEIYSVIPLHENNLTEITMTRDGKTMGVIYKSTIKLPYVAGLRYVYNF